MMLWNCYPSLFIHHRHLSWQREWDLACDFYLGPLAFLLLLSLPLSPVSLSNLPLSLCHSLCSSSSVSVSIFLSASIYPVFLWNVMIHWLWSLWAVSLKSVCLLSATTEWYITSITCNFLGFIRYIYSPYNGEDCSFLQLSSEYRLLHHGPVHGNHYLVWECAKIRLQSLSLGKILKLELM